MSDNSLKRTFNDGIIQFEKDNAITYKPIQIRSCRVEAETNQVLLVSMVGYLTQENNLLDESILTNITLEFNEDKIDKNLFNDVVTGDIFSFRFIGNNHSVPKYIQTHIFDILWGYKAPSIHESNGFGRKG